MTKQELREILKKRRDSIDPVQKRAMDQSIVQAIASSKVFAQASAVLLYAPIGSEIDLMPLAEMAQQAGKTVAFPKCNTDTCTMEFYVLEKGAVLQEGAYRIPEPAENAPLFAADARTLCILPALTLDPRGRRLGYGKGYYDRFLRNFCGTKVGFCYSDFFVDKLPVGKYDTGLDMLITEKGIYNFNA